MIVLAASNFIISLFLFSSQEELRLYRCAKRKNKARFGKGFDRSFHMIDLHHLIWRDNGNNCLAAGTMRPDTWKYQPLVISS